MSAGLLEGVRVLDFTQMLAGPLCTRMMADLSADVVKVEPPGGDHIRGAQPVRGGHSAYFGHLNCGKRSIVLDLKRPEAIAAAERLAAHADVVVENFRPGVIARLGLGYERLAAINPRLVYCSISGYGQTGPDRGKPAYAPMVHAASGYDLSLLGYQEHGEKPLRTGIFVADVLAASNAFGAINAALLARARTGRGQFVDVTLIEGMLNLLVFDTQNVQFPSERRRPLYTPVAASDGWIVVAPITQANFEALADAAGHPEWKRDERFATSAERGHHWHELMALVEEWSRTRSAIECEAVMARAGVPCSRYVTLAEALASPHLAERGSLATVEDPARAYQVPNPPFRFSDASAGARPWVAALGEHGDAVLRENGFSPAEIAALRDSGTLG